MPPTESPSALAAAIARRAGVVRERIATAAIASGRALESVTLVAVTKTHPLATVEAALAAGLTDLGENRVQELLAKAEAHPGAWAGGAQAAGAHRWHLIGPLQRNKARDAVQAADLVHGVDSERLARALDVRAAAVGRVLPVLVQVNISGEASKSGVAPEAAHDVLAALAGLANVQPVGLMGLAAEAMDRAEAERTVRPAFRRLRALADTYAGPGRDAISVVSMGMSGDFEMAIEEGATLVRIGTALFGTR